MTDDPFAFHVEQLTRRHHRRHTSATVAEVTLQRWLTLRRRYNDPFDPVLFDHIDEVLLRMPPSVVEAPAARPVGTRRPGAVAAPRGNRVRAGRSVVDRPVSRSV